MCNFGKEGRVECCQNRIYIWSISAIFSWTLGCGYIDLVVGKHPLEFSFYKVFPSFGDLYILKTDDLGSLFEYLVYFLVAPLVPSTMIGCHTNTATAPLSACYEVPEKMLPIQADLSWSLLPHVPLALLLFLFSSQVIISCSHFALFV